MLSREEAIRKHREMWNWIAERIRESESVQDIVFLKQEYTRWQGEFVIYCCYLCDYCMDKVSEDEWYERCKYCPLDWGLNVDEDGIYQCLSYYDEVGLYSKAERATVWEEQYKLCKKIANLKER